MSDTDKKDKEKKIVKPALPTTRMPETGRLQTQPTLSATRGEVAAANRARKVAENEKEIFRTRADSARSIAEIGKGLVSWTESLVQIQENKHRLEVNKIKHEQQVSDAKNEHFLNETFRDKRNAIAAMAVDDDFATAEANSEFVRLELEERLVRKRKELELAKREFAALVEPKPDETPLLEAMQRQEAYARLIVRDAADNVTVKTDARHLYHAFAACHYLAGKLRGLNHDALVADLVKLVLDRMRFNPMEYDDAMDYQKRWQTLKGVSEARAAQDRSAAAAAQEREAQIMMERLRVEAAEAKARAAAAYQSIYGNPAYDPTK